jgi:hypothetical protein
VDVQIYVFSTSAQLEVSGQLHVPAAFIPEKEPPIPNVEAVWAPEQVQTICRKENVSPNRDSNLGSSVVPNVGSRYSDYTIPDFSKNNEEKTQRTRRVLGQAETPCRSQKSFRTTVDRTDVPLSGSSSISWLPTPQKPYCVSITKTSQFTSTSRKLKCCHLLGYSAV